VIHKHTIINQQVRTARVPNIGAARWIDKIPARTKLRAELAGIDMRIAWRFRPAVPAQHCTVG
jgi:hypothetical protein